MWGDDKWISNRIFFLHSIKRATGLANIHNQYAFSQFAWTTARVVDPCNLHKLSSLFPVFCSIINGCGCVTGMLREVEIEPLSWSIYTTLKALQQRGSKLAKWWNVCIECCVFVFGTVVILDMKDGRLMGKWDELSMRAFENRQLIAL